MDKPAIKQMLAVLVGATVVLFSARTSWANSLGASYDSGDPVYVDYHGCGVARGDNIQIYLSLYSYCVDDGTEISDQTAGISMSGKCDAYGGTYSIGCPTSPYPSYWVCALDTTTSVWSNTVSLSTAPGCTDAPASTQSEQGALLTVPWVWQPPVSPWPVRYWPAFGSDGDGVALSFASPQFVPWAASMNTTM